MASLSRRAIQGITYDPRGEGFHAQCRSLFAIRYPPVSTVTGDLACLHTAIITGNLASLPPHFFCFLLIPISRFHIYLTLIPPTALSDNAKRVGTSGAETFGGFVTHTHPPTHATALAKSRTMCMTLLLKVSGAISFC